MSIIFCDGKYAASLDHAGWRLRHYYWSLNKKKDKETKKFKETYHANLRQVVRHVLDREAGDCGSLNELMGLLDSAEDLLFKHAKKKL